MNLLCQTITVATCDHIATITLNRPSTKNAMNIVMIDELITVAQKLQQSCHIRAVIIHGTGGDFCSGFDTSELNGRINRGRVAYELIKPSMSMFQKVCLIWRTLPMPVVAVIDGVCLGAGLQLALGADFRLATPYARFGLPESKWGLTPDMGISWTAFDIPKDSLKQLAMTAKIVDAQRAAAMQLITVIDDEPMNVAVALCHDMMDNSPDAILAAKRVINRATAVSKIALYYEKLWQIKLIIGYNRKVAIANAKNLARQTTTKAKNLAKDSTKLARQEFSKRQFR